MHAQFAPRVGDLIRRPKAIITKHVGVYAGPGWVFHNAPRTGARVVPLAEFAAGYPVEVVRTNVHPHVAVQRMRTRLVDGRPYDVLSNNCEHAAFEIVADQKVSPQLQLIILGLIVGIVVMATATSSGS